jgi:hypothetical protein
MQVWSKFNLESASIEKRQATAKKQRNRAISKFNNILLLLTCYF